MSATASTELKARPVGSDADSTRRPCQAPCSSIANASEKTFEIDWMENAVVDISRRHDLVVGGDYLRPQTVLSPPGRGRGM